MVRLNTVYNFLYSRSVKIWVFANLLCPLSCFFELDSLKEEGITMVIESSLALRG